MTAIAATAPLRIALVGNPNSGKTALFNQLTGSRQKVANYTGVTVERKEGRLRAPSGREFAVLDLPGAYSLHPASLDEAITRDLCRGFYPGEAAPDVLLCVIDATNLRLHLRFALELRELGKPMVVALNMVDAAQRRGIQVDVAALERELANVRRLGSARDDEELEMGVRCMAAGIYDDQRYAIPLDVHPLAQYHNNALFQKAGLTEDFMAAAESP